MMAKQYNQYDVILDVREDRCPMPLLKTKIALSKMQVSESLCVITSDSGSLKDIPQYLDIVNASLLSLHEGDDLYTFVIKKN